MSAIRDDRAPVMSGAAERPRLAAMIVAWGPVAVWMAVIFSLSSDQFSDVNTAAWLSGMPIVRVFGLPPAVIEAGNFIVRKCMHFVEYAVLAMLTLRAMRATRPGYSDRRLLAAAVIVAALCASMDELHQHLRTLTRSGTPTDVVLDSFGALAGAVVGAMYLYRRTPPGDA